MAFFEDKSTGFNSPDEGLVHFIARGLIAGRGFKQEERVDS